MIGDDRAREEWDRAAGTTRSFHEVFNRHDFDSDDFSVGERGLALGYLSQRKWYKYAGTPEGERLLGMNLKDCNSGAGERQDRFRTLMSHSFTFFVELSQSREIVIGDHRRCAIAFALLRRCWCVGLCFLPLLEGRSHRSVRLSCGGSRILAEVL